MGGLLGWVANMVGVVGVALCIITPAAFVANIKSLLSKVGGGIVGSVFGSPPELSLKKKKFRKLRKARETGDFREE